MEQEKGECIKSKPGVSAGGNYNMKTKGAKTDSKEWRKTSSGRGEGLTFKVFSSEKAKTGEAVLSVPGFLCGCYG